jgi:hypothetical protein
MSKETELNGAARAPAQSSRYAATTPDELRVAEAVVAEDWQIGDTILMCSLAARCLQLLRVVHPGSSRPARCALSALPYPSRYGRTVHAYARRYR